MVTKRPSENGFSVIELLLVLVLISVIAMIAVPRFGDHILGPASAMAAAREMAADLRLCRTLAVTHGSTNSTGYAVQMQGTAPYTGYVIVDSESSVVASAKTFSDGVAATGDAVFSFGPLGNLATGSGTTLVLTGGSKTCQLDLTAANGSVFITE